MVRSANPRLRFAPSPNGELHLGHALSALINHQQAQQLNGTLLLRIEDIDIGRTREHFIDQIYEDLSWLGLDWPQPVLRQSARLGAYRDAARRLDEMGLLYPCFATRKDIQLAAQAKAAAANQPIARDPDGAFLYPLLHKDLPPGEIERRKSAGEPFALRLDMERAIAAARQASPSWPPSFVERDEDGQINSVAVDPSRWGDAVIVRKDVPTSYHLAVVVDDEFQNITHVTRGADLAAATGIHRLLQILLGFTPPLYHHHRLVLDQDGNKLSKSGGAQSLTALRQAGHNADDISRLIGMT